MPPYKFAELERLIADKRAAGQFPLNGDERHEGDSQALLDHSLGSFE